MAGRIEAVLINLSREGFGNTSFDGREKAKNPKQNLGSPFLFNLEIGLMDCHEQITPDLYGSWFEVAPQWSSRLTGSQQAALPCMSATVWSKATKKIVCEKTVNECGGLFDYFKGSGLVIEVANEFMLIWNDYLGLVVHFGRELKQSFQQMQAVTFKARAQCESRHCAFHAVQVQSAKEVRFKKLKTATGAVIAAAPKGFLYAKCENGDKVLLTHPDRSLLDLKHSIGLEVGESVELLYYKIWTVRGHIYISAFFFQEDEDNYFWNGQFDLLIKRGQATDEYLDDKFLDVKSKSHLSDDQFRNEWRKHFNVWNPDLDDIWWIPEDLLIQSENSSRSDASQSVEDFSTRNLVSSPSSVANETMLDDSQLPVSSVASEERVEEQPKKEEEQRVGQPMVESQQEQPSDISREEDEPTHEEETRINISAAVAPMVEEEPSSSEGQSSYAPSVPVFPYPPQFVRRVPADESNSTISTPLRAEQRLWEQEILSSLLDSTDSTFTGRDSSSDGQKEEKENTIPPVTAAQIGALRISSSGKWVQCRKKIWKKMTWEEIAKGFARMKKEREAIEKIRTSEVKIYQRRPSRSSNTTMDSFVSVEIPAVAPAPPRVVPTPSPPPVVPVPAPPRVVPAPSRQQPSRPPSVGTATVRPLRTTPSETPILVMPSRVPPRGSSIFGGPIASSQSSISRSSNVSPQPMVSHPPPAPPQSDRMPSGKNTTTSSGRMGSGVGSCPSSRPSPAEVASRPASTGSVRGGFGSGSSPDCYERERRLRELKPNERSQLLPRRLPDEEIEDYLSRIFCNADDWCSATARLALNQMSACVELRVFLDHTHPALFEILYIMYTYPDAVYCGDLEKIRVSVDASGSAHLDRLEMERQVLKYMMQHGDIWNQVAKLLPAVPEFLDPIRQHIMT